MKKFGALQRNRPAETVRNQNCELLKNLIRQHLQDQDASDEQIAQFGLQNQGDPCWKMFSQQLTGVQQDKQFVNSKTLFHNCLLRKILQQRKTQELQVILKRLRSFIDTNLDRIIDEINACEYTQLKSKILSDFYEANEYIKSQSTYFFQTTREHVWKEFDKEFQNVGEAFKSSGKRLQQNQNIIKHINVLKIPELPTNHNKTSSKSVTVPTKTENCDDSSHTSPFDYNFEYQ